MAAINTRRESSSGVQHDTVRDTEEYIRRGEDKAGCYYVRIAKWMIHLCFGSRSRMCAQYEMISKCCILVLYCTLVFHHAFPLCRDHGVLRSFGESTEVFGKDR